MLHGAYGEKHQSDHRRQGNDHHPVCPRVLQSEEVGEAYHRYTPEYKDGPKHSGDVLFGCDQAHPSCVGHSLDLIQSFCVELLVGLCAWLEILDVCSDV